MAVGMSLPRTLIKNVRNHVGADVKLQGWVKAIRDQKKMQFLIVRDHTGICQATVARTAEHASLNDTISSLTRESAVTVIGRVVENPVVKVGGVEVLIAELRVDGPADRTLPLDPFGPAEANPDVRLNWRFLDLRRPENLLVFKVQTAAVQAMREFWLREGFVEIFSPKLMGSASESGAELFALEYFGRPAYLAQSPQFYKQMAIAAGFDRVFEIGPAFRADPSFTTRHATEFTSVDVEMAWVESHDDVMKLTERWLRSVLASIDERFGEEIQQTFGMRVRVPEVPFPRLSMERALEVVAARGHTPERSGDLDPAGERLVGEHVAEQADHEFVFVTDYPATVRAFYHMRDDSNRSLTKSFDLLWKGIEMATGAQREHRYETLIGQAREKGLNLDPIQFYLDFFRFGCPPHGGFGFGLARMLMVLLNLPNIRESTLLFRGPTRLIP